MVKYATMEDLEALWRPLRESERERAEQLLSLVSSCLRVEAKKVGKNLDAMAQVDRDFKEVVKSVTIDVVARTLMTSTNSEPMSQYSESAGGYSVSGTYLVAGGGIFVKNSELARLGLKKQKIGALDFYGID